MTSVIRALEELSELGGVVGPRGVEILRRSIGAVYAELDDQVGQDDFRELKDAVLVLAKAQQQTELKLDQLAEAQKRTEIKVEALAEAQRKTEARLDALTEKVKALAEAQRKTEEEIRLLTRAVVQLQKDVGGLAQNAGFLLEDRAYVSLPFLLEHRFGLRVTSPLRRTFLDVGGDRYEINIWGEAEKSDGTSVRIVGEAKAQLASKHLTGFERVLRKIRSAFREEPFLVFVVSQAEPEHARDAEARGVHLIYSYELEDARDQRLISELKKAVSGTAP